ncbi:MAG: alpha/beta hydrolase [Caldimonas sp.]
MDDVRAVLDAVGWEQAAIWGISEGGPMAMMFAATYPARTRALLLYGTFARFSRAEDYPYGYPASVNALWVPHLNTTWGTGELSRRFAPSLTEDKTSIRALARLERMAMSPGTARKVFGMMTELDVRHVLPAIRVPTLVLHRVHDQPVRVGHARYLAEHIAGSRYVELAGEDHLPWCGDIDALLDEAREFLTGERAETEPDRVLTTILFCDIAESTQRLAAMGDLAWKQVLPSFYTLAVRCGVSLARGVEALGLRLRVGVHSGECEVLGE